MIWKDAFIRETIFLSRTLLVSNNERIWKAGLSSACLPQLEGIEITIAIPWALRYFLLLVDKPSWLCKCKVRMNFKTTEIFW